MDAQVAVDHDGAMGLGAQVSCERSAQPVPVEERDHHGDAGQYSDGNQPFRERSLAGVLHTKLERPSLAMVLQLGPVGRSLTSQASLATPPRERTAVTSP